MNRDQFEKRSQMVNNADVNVMLTLMKIEDSQLVTYRVNLNPADMIIITEPNKQPGRVKITLRNGEEFFYGTAGDGSFDYLVQLRAKAINRKHFLKLLTIEN